MMSAPDARTSSGRIALTVAAVPTGMNAGVRMSPRAVAIEPLRALPSVSVMVKEKAVTRRALATAGIPVYENDAIRLVKDGKPFWIAGLGDQTAFPVRERRIGGKHHTFGFAGVDDLPGMLAKVGDEAPVVMMAHEPDIFASTPSRVALTVCGHTHGGQLRVPGFAPLVPSRYGTRYLYGHIVEDMKMGVDLARRGAPPVLCPQALVTSTFPVSRAGAASQRTRWEHGHLGMIVDEVPRLLRDAARGIGAGLVPMALEICVPPKALLLLLLLAVTALTALAAALGASAWPLVLATAELGLFAVAVTLAWMRFARDILPLSEVPRIALYVLAKIPLYLGFLVRRQVEWVRSKRDAD